jgi:predicted acyltransferase
MSQPARDGHDNVVLLKSTPGTAVRAQEGLLRGSEVREPPAADATRPLSAAVSGRLTSVDALRGFSIFWILGGDGLAWSLQTMTADKGGVVATMGSAVARQFTHVPWEGFRFYDFIFPLFVFTTGVAIVLSLPKLVEREGKAAAHRRVFRRFVLLFLLGILYYGGVSKEWPDIRLLGVLQRIALCYLFASLLFLYFRPRGLVVAFAALLVGYWALMTFIPVPGIGAGSFARDANLANWIDMHYLPGKKWDGAWDPEGLLSTLPAIGTCLMGVFAGMLLTNPRMQPGQKSLWLIGAGIASVLAGYLWGLQFPVIKNIWTSSFVLVAGGYSLILLGVMHQLIDVWGIKAWATIFIWIGANAITLYFLNNVASFEQFATRFVGGDMSAFLDSVVTPGAGYLAAYAGGLVVAVALAGFLYRRKIFLRV